MGAGPHLRTGTRVVRVNLGSSAGLSGNKARRLCFATRWHEWVVIQGRIHDVELATEALNLAESVAITMESLMIAMIVTQGHREMTECHDAVDGDI